MTAKRQGRTLRKANGQFNGSRPGPQQEIRRMPQTRDWKTQEWLDDLLTDAREYAGALATRNTSTDIKAAIKALNAVISSGKAFKRDGATNAQLESLNLRWNTARTQADAALGRRRGQ